jgi:hypothetical protein
MQSKGGQAVVVYELEKAKVSYRTKKILGDSPKHLLATAHLKEKRARTGQTNCAIKAQSSQTNSKEPHVT